MLARCVLVLVFVSLVASHVKIYYAPSNLSIRNAASATADGTFSTDATGCGGAMTFGSNGINSVEVGQMIPLHFNYGTGTSGDHADPTNAFFVSFVTVTPTDTQATVLPKETDDANELVTGIAAPAGSTPAGYSANIRIPYPCTQCLISVLDQRSWGGCIDVTATLPSYLTGTMNPDGSFALSSGHGEFFPATGAITCDTGYVSNGSMTACVLSGGAAFGIFLLVFIIVVVGSLVGVMLFLKYKKPETYHKIVDKVTSKFKRGGQTQQTA